MISYMNVLYEFFKRRSGCKLTLMTHSITPMLPKRMFLSPKSMSFVLGVYNSFQAFRTHLFQLNRFNAVALYCTVSLILLVGFDAKAQSLSSTLQAALEVDPSLQSAAANRVVATENVGIAKSRLLPQMNVQGSQSNLSQTTTQNTTLGPQANGFRGTSYNYTLSVRQSLIRPRDWAGLTVGKQQALYGELKFQSAKSDLWNRASGAWLDLLAASMNREAYAKAIKGVSESAKQEKMRFERGDGTRDSMIEAQAQLTQAKAMLEDAELSLKSKLRAVELLSGIRPNDWERRSLPEETKVIFKNEEKATFLEKIEEEMPELLAARVIERINQLKVDQARYDHYPTLDAYGQSTNAQNDTTNTLGYQYRNNQVGVQLNLPLYNGGGLEATRRQNIATYEGSVADREALALRIGTQFDADWAAQAGFIERAAAARSLVFSALEQKKAAEAGIVQGMKTWTDVGNAEILLARRVTDLNSVLLNLYKYQARILSLLPSDDPAWEEWISKMDLASVH